MNCDDFYDAKETDECQRWIWEAMHPPNCSTARLWTAPMWPFGMGSIFHVWGLNLGVAMEHHRVLLWDSFSFADTSLVMCPTDSFDCYLYPTTSCGPEHVLPGETHLAPQAPYVDHPDQRVVRPPSAYTTGPELFELDYVPSRWRHKGNSWWRARRRTTSSSRRSGCVSTSRGRPGEVFPDGVPHPLVSMHVRHGDKAREMELMNLTAYVNALKRTGNVQRFGIRDVFLSTEDEAVIGETALFPEFRWWFTKVPRLNTSPRESIRVLGKANEVLISFVQLYLAVQADFFMGQRKSNWCRMIDELRKVNGKARTAYVSPSGDEAYEQ